MYHLNNFCNIISSLRRSKGWSQATLADRLRISPQAVSKWECGIGYPDVMMFPILAETLDIPIGVLFGKELNVQKVKQKEEKMLPESNVSCIYRERFSMPKTIRVLFGNPCRVEVFKAPPEFSGIGIEASGDSVFMHYLEAEHENDNALTVRIKNPSGSEDYWKPYHRQDYDGDVSFSLVH